MSQQSSRFLENAYCVMAAVFFAACAFAQSNDPDPEWWVAGYIVGGCILNLLVMLQLSSAKLLIWITQAFAALTAGFLLWWVVALLPKLEYSLLPDMKAFAWRFLEFEEGREIGGLVILLLHMLKLLSFQQTKTSTSKNDAGSSSAHPFGTILMLAVIGGAVYLWVYFQPEMNMRENMEHCSNVFQNTIFSRKTVLSEEL